MITLRVDEKAMRTVLNLVAQIDDSSPEELRHVQHVYVAFREALPKNPPDLTIVGVPI